MMQVTLVVRESPRMLNQQRPGGEAAAALVQVATSSAAPAAGAPCEPLSADEDPTILAARLLLLDGAVALASPNAPQQQPFPNAPWISELLATPFFSPCASHDGVKRNECSYFCTTCTLHSGRSMQHCHHCRSKHMWHDVLQIRRYGKHDGVRTQDMDPFFDTEGIQGCALHSHLVVLLNPKPQAKFAGPAEAECINCHRAVKDGSIYCCVACKVQILQGGGGCSAQDAPAGSSLLCRGAPVSRRPSSSCSSLGPATLPPAFPHRRRPSHKGAAAASFPPLPLQQQLHQQPLSHSSSYSGAAQLPYQPHPVSLAAAAGDRRMPPPAPHKAEAAGLALEAPPLVDPSNNVTMLQGTVSGLVRGLPSHLAQGLAKGLVQGLAPGQGMGTEGLRVQGIVPQQPCVAGSSGAMQGVQPSGGLMGSLGLGMQGVQGVGPQGSGGPAVIGAMQDLRGFQSMDWAPLQQQQQQEEGMAAGAGAEEERAGPAFVSVPTQQQLAAKLRAAASVVLGKGGVGTRLQVEVENPSQQQQQAGEGPQSGQQAPLVSERAQGGHSGEEQQQQQQQASSAVAPCTASERPQQQHEQQQRAHPPLCQQQPTPVPHSQQQQQPKRRGEEEDMSGKAQGEPLAKKLKTVTRSGRTVRPPAWAGGAPDAAAAGATTEGSKAGGGQGRGVMASAQSSDAEESSGSHFRVPGLQVGGAGDVAVGGSRRRKGAPQRSHHD